MLTVARILLVAWQWERVIDVNMLLPVFVQGLRFDLVLLGMTLVCSGAAVSAAGIQRALLLPVWRAFL